MNARKLKTLSPEEKFEHYKEDFWKKVDKLIEPKKNEPKGNGDCTKYGIPSARGVFSTARKTGYSRRSSRISEATAYVKRVLAFHFVRGFALSGGLEFITDAYKMCPELKEKQENGRYVEGRAGRMLGTLLFEVPFNFIGWESDNYIAAKEADKTTKPTPEHIYPRQFDGEFILSHLTTKGEISYDMFSRYVDVFSQTAKVLSEENVRLEKYQKSHLFVQPELSYMAAGVNVTTDPNTEILRLEEVAPPEVIDGFFGARVA